MFWNKLSFDYISYIIIIKLYLLQIIIITYFNQSEHENWNFFSKLFKNLK